MNVDSESNMEGQWPDNPVWSVPVCVQQFYISCVVIMQ